MSSRALVIFVFTVLAAGSASVGCGGGETEPKLTSTPTPAATATPTPTPAVSPTAVALPLDEYLVLTLRIDADFNRINADLAETLPSLQEDPQEVLRASVELLQGFSQIFGGAAERLSEVTPPPEAEAYHRALVAIFRDFEDVGDELAAAGETGDPSRILASALDLTAVAFAFGEVEEQRQNLVITALIAAGDDPLNSYLISAAEARRDVAAALAELGPELQDLLASGDIGGSLAVLEELIGKLEDFEDRWQQLSPPLEAQELHQRQLEVTAKQIEGELLVLQFVQDQDEGALMAGLESLQEFSVQGGRLMADWDELLIDVLSR